MRCITIENPGSESKLLITEQETPVCGDDDILVKVKATAINRGDLMQRMGKYPPPAGTSQIPGLELAGDVVAIGNQVSRFKIGERVYGLVAGGSYAEYCLVNQNIAEHIPKQWDYEYAAAIPEALITAHATVFLLGQLRKQQTFLIHAAGSNITCMAIQMAHKAGANIFTTTSNQEKIDKAVQLGASTVINYKQDDFATIVGSDTVDVIVDFIGGDYFPKHLKILKAKGRLIQIACMQGHKVECDLALLMRKRLHIDGFVLRPQTIAEKSVLWRSAHERWQHALLDGEIKPIIDSIYSFNQIDQAHQRMQSSDHFGKIVINCF